MPASTLITAGSGAILVPSALSYPQAVDPTTYLPYSSPQILISSGTWRHPKPGFPISMTYAVFGGGGGGSDRNDGGTCAGSSGGSGRITFVTATVTTDLAVTIGAGGTLGSSGGTGGSTIFNATTAAGGSGGVDRGAGGDGGFGGAGCINVSTPSAGGIGLDYIGGAGAFAGTGAACGLSNSGQNARMAANSSVPGWPNGVTDFTGGLRALGGNPILLFPWCQEYGKGGNGRGYNGVNAGTAGKQGAVFIWYNRP